MSSGEAKNRDYQSLHVTSLLSRKRETEFSHTDLDIFICNKIWLKIVETEKDTIKENYKRIPSRSVDQTSYPDIHASSVAHVLNPRGMLREHEKSLKITSWMLLLYLDYQWQI